MTQKLCLVYRFTTLNYPIHRLQQVFANFTFGEPVRGGRCSVVVWAPLMRWEARSSQAGQRWWRLFEPCIADMRRIRVLQIASFFFFFGSVLLGWFEFRLPPL